MIFNVIEFLKMFFILKRIDYTCRKYNIKNWIINNGKIDVQGDVDLSDMGLKSLNIFNGISFGAISGDFNCCFNYLQSLKYGPSYVGNDYKCYYNNLGSLEYAPDEVGGDFLCYNAKLVTLFGSPSKIGGSFYCGYNKIKRCPK